MQPVLSHLVSTVSAGTAGSVSPCWAEDSQLHVRYLAVPSFLPIRVIIAAAWSRLLLLSCSYSPASAPVACLVLIIFHPFGPSVAYVQPELLISLES